MKHKAKILVVEDRDDWQEIVCETISTAGHVPFPAMSFQEAKAVMERQQLDLAVVDPVLDRDNRFNRDGLSVIQKLAETQPDIPIIVITGSLTHDLKTSLQQLCPGAPVLAKESWTPSEFTRLMLKRMGEPRNAAPGDADRAELSTTGVPASLAPPPADLAIGRPRVLLVENRADWQNIVAGVLDEAGYFWRTASNAQEALLELENESFHLVILDLKLKPNNLPLRSNEGWLLLDHMVETRPKTQVLILSGRASPADVADLLTHYPIVGFIEKRNFTPQIIKDAVAQATQAPELRIQTLGQFKLWRDDQAVAVWVRPQAETVVKLLLIRRARGGRAVAADELITHLWPDADEESGRKKLLPLISNARHTLEPDIEPRDSNFILRSATGYFFELSGINWDLLHFRSHLQQGRQLAQAERWEEAIKELEQGRALYRGDFLAEDRYANWAIDIRREIAGEFRDLLILLADTYAKLLRYAEAIEVCEVALRKDPLLESVYRRLMKLHYCSGEKGQALKVYRDCLKLFEELFGESPTPATRQLHDVIANDEVIDC